MTDEAVRAMADRIEELDRACSEWADASQANYQRAKKAEAKLAKAVGALQSVMEACDQGRMIPRSSVGGMTIEANIKGSIYVGVSAWPIEEARTTLAELTVSATVKDSLTTEDEKQSHEWQCPIDYPGCRKNCGGYICKN